jgi:hypothetical protein
VGGAVSQDQIQTQFEHEAYQVWSKATGKTSEAEFQEDLAAINNSIQAQGGAIAVREAYLEQRKK